MQAHDELIPVNFRRVIRFHSEVGTGMLGNAAAMVTWSALDGTNAKPMASTGQNEERPTLQPTLDIWTVSEEEKERTKYIWLTICGIVGTLVLVCELYQRCKRCLNNR